mgnify:CR=1 FL=1
MVKFIELTKLDSKKVLINVNNITYVSDYTNTVIHLLAPQTEFSVQESYIDVMNKIMN